jgi:glycosyltransferase involved in cell wall biosynthesis
MHKMTTYTGELAIITATFNVAAHLPILMESLRAQTNKNFEWVVADGNSTDGTVELLKNCEDLNISWVSEHDFGIYDAMNKAIKRSNAKYYLVVGSDDVLAPNAIENILKELNAADDIDVLVGQAIANGKIYERKPGYSWIYGASAYVNAHSVGTVFKKSLHNKFGYYSNHYPIAADGYFMKIIFQSKQINAKYVDDVYGTFGTKGISNTAVLRAYVENLHIQLITEKYALIQIAIFIVRYLKLKFSIMRKAA